MIAEARGQFELAWSLTELHLAALVDEDFFWEPAHLCWTVRQDHAGRWRPDWGDAEPDPVPVPTIAWLTWHIDYWWTMTIDSLTGVPRRDRSEVIWPGNGAAAVARIRDLAERWRNLMADMTDQDLAVVAAYPWEADAGRTLADTVLWVSVELTKNVAELGQLRLIRAAGR